MLQLLEDITNTFSDADKNWWPFLFMRPRKHQKLLTGRAMIVSVLYGALLGTAANLLGVLAEEPPPFDSSLSLPIIFTLIFFALLRGVLGWAWNRRAKRASPKPW